MTQPAAVASALMDRIFSLLAPLFLAATGGDFEAAREAVRSTLASSDPHGDAEWLLGALINAFGFGVLDVLGTAAGPGHSLDRVIRLRSHAVALSRAENRNQAVLDGMRKRRPGESGVEPERVRPGVCDEAEAEEMLNFARSVLRGRLQPPGSPTRH
jgi:hypothetical protein